MAVNLKLKPCVNRTGIHPYFPNQLLNKLKEDKDYNRPHEHRINLQSFWMFQLKEKTML